MAFPNPAARNQYLKTQVETASKEQLVVMLFDGIIRFTEQARKAIEEKQIEASHNALMRAQAIVMELIVTVDKDKGGDVAKNLMALHAYSFNCLVQCNLQKDIAKIDEVQKIYRNLREGWVAAMDSLGIAPNSVRSTTAAAQAPAQPQAAAPAAQVPVGQPGRPVPPSGGRPLPTGAPKASSPAAARPLPSAGTIAPQKPGGILAAAKPAATPPAAPAAPKPAMPATGYGIGRSAMIGAAYGAKPAPAAPATPTPAAPQAPAPTTITPGNPKQAAMLGAYQNNARNIA